MKLYIPRRGSTPPDPEELLQDHERGISEIQRLLPLGSTGEAAREALAALEEEVASLRYTLWEHRRNMDFIELYYSKLEDSISATTSSIDQT